MKEKWEKTYSGTSLVCDCCGWRMMVEFKEPLQTFEDYTHYTSFRDMPIFNGDTDGSQI